MIWYLRNNPSGAHALEARSALRVASPKFADRRMQTAWRSAGTEACRTPTRAADCERVEKFLADYPNASYAEQAGRILKDSAKKITALKAKERAEAIAEQRKAEAEARAKQRELEERARRGEREAEAYRRKRERCADECRVGPYTGTASCFLACVGE